MNVDGKMFPYVENMLDWAAKRQQTISANLANIDTPGYKARDISFSEHMQSIGLDTTSAQHIQTVSGNGMNVYEIDAKEKDNGNTVDLDQQMTDLTKNGLQYVAMVQFLNQKIRTLRAAIVEGGK
jgi:flagellar basal-body rod protein FlgB